jgi:hypothetical protein
MAGFITLSPKSSSDLQQVIGSLEKCSAEMSANIQKWSNQVANPEWQKGVASRSTTPLEQRFLAGTALASVGPSAIILSAGALSASASGGLSTSIGGMRGDGWKAAEFGANRNAVSTYFTRSRKGNRYKVTRHTQRQFKWANHQKGIAVYPTARDLVPRLIELILQTTVRLMHDGVEGKL